MLGSRVGSRGAFFGSAVGSSADDEGTIVAGPTFQAVGAVDRQTGALTAVWPAHQAGDIAYLTVFNSHNATMVAATLGTAAGFTLIGSAEGGPFGGLYGRVTTFWCRASSGAQASPITVANGSWSAAWITTVRGAAPAGDPTDDFDTTVCNVGDVTAFTAGPNVTLGTNRLILSVAGALCAGDITGMGSVANAALTGVTERLDDQGLAGTERVHVEAITGTKITPGSTGTTTGVYAASYSVWAAMTIAVKAS